MAHSLGQFTPVFLEKATGDQLAPDLEKEHGGVDPDPRLTEYIGFVGKRLLPFGPRNDFPRKFKVLKSDKIVNAFALGNGNVYVTRAILNLMDDEAELAEILGHESAGHVGKRHIAHRIDQAVGLSLLLGTAEAFYTREKGDKLSEGQKGMIDAANAVVPSLVLNGFGRSHESEADQFGLDAMVRAGYDPMGAVRVFQKFQKLEPEVKGLAVFFRSHPTARARISDLSMSIRSRYPEVKGESFRDRYHAIVHGGASLSDTEGPRILGMKPIVAVGAGTVLALGTVLLVLSV